MSLSDFQKVMPQKANVICSELVTDPAQTEEDWALIFSICQEVNRTELGGKEARKALQKKMNSNLPATQIHVFTVRCTIHQYITH
jgi:hypothetical protein